MRTALIALSLALAASACATAPTKTLAGLNAEDSRYASRECVAARKEAAAFDDHKDGRTVISLVGNLIVPFAGSATSFAMDRLRDDERKALNRRVKAACISDPLAGKGSRRKVATR